VRTSAIFAQDAPAALRAAILVASTATRGRPSFFPLARALRSPREEARALLALVQGRSGGTAEAIEEVRQLIAVSPEVRETLRRYCRRHPEERKGIMRVLRFRRRVAEEFEKLVAGGAELGFNLSSAGLQAAEPLAEGV